MCVTSVTIFSYGMRVGPITPITPESEPEWYSAVTTVKSEKLGSTCSFPIVIETYRECLQEVLDVPDNIPQELLEKAECVIVICMPLMEP